jgi:hypothetical protein
LRNGDQAGVKSEDPFSVPAGVPWLILERAGAFTLYPGLAACQVPASHGGLLAEEPQGPARGRRSIWVATWNTRPAIASTLERLAAASCITRCLLPPVSISRRDIKHRLKAAGADLHLVRHDQTF